MEEAAVSQSPAQFHSLFAILVALCGLNKPITLWENHKEAMTEDFLHQARSLSAGKFANKLLQIGDGKVPEDPSTGIIIMPCGHIVNSPDELLSKVYPNIQQNFKDQDSLSHRAILASRNDVVEKLNVTIQKQLPGQEYAYKSIKCILNDDEAIQYPIEFLSSTQTPDLLAQNSGF
ncbi:ATP-dependent DNA helicase [Trichonephila inaurata madagascariensis]|uniref:ATP-dependent DNA helicase n=1 Tax=Trichonephila inaurata madagascariensis TaxID=2747483 RepID=A0A8X6XDN9_9ARAC|nr:ATP-dependent DNA helicase [Trichonephila inaurata madagascariensis]